MGHLIEPRIVRCNVTRCPCSIGKGPMRQLATRSIVLEQELVDVAFAEPLVDQLPKAERRKSVVLKLRGNDISQAVQAVKDLVQDVPASGVRIALGVSCDKLLIDRIEMIRELLTP